VSTALRFLFFALSVLALIPTLVLLAQITCAVFLHRRKAAPLPPRPRLALLVPAHNEAAGIAATLGSLSPELKRGDRLVVVADNCSDDTARIAAAAGAEVVQRHDLARRGKGYALDAGVRYLERDPPAIVVIIDADCRVEPGAIERIARASAAAGRPVQALYLMEASVSAGPLQPIVRFAWIVKNLVRPLGMYRLGLPCQLMGTGMAFPWRTLRAARVASSHLVEDVKLGIDLALAGTPPLFCPDARVWSRFPESPTGAHSQRTRWEHGHLSMILGEAPRLMLQGLLGHGSGVLALALDLCVPPLALLSLAIVASICAGAFSYALLGDVLPLGIALLAGACLLAAILVAWARFGRQILSLARLASAPWYVLSKLPVYIKFVIRREVEWVRSSRDTVAGEREDWRNRWATIIDRMWVVRSTRQYTTLLDWLVSGKTARIVGFVNAHAMNVSAARGSFFKALVSADVLLRDGSGMSILFRILHRSPGWNMNGTDFIPKLLAAYRGKSIALWGTAQPWIGTAATQCERRFGVRIVSCADGFRDRHSYVELARTARPALIILGMGMPKQEELAQELKRHADPDQPPLIVCGGAILDFLGGKVRRAPAWMRRCGLEWLYRLLHEPRRLWGRYVMGNPSFVMRLLDWRHDERFSRNWSLFQ